MDTRDYDIVVVGAGIQGCGVAQVAAAAGYRVLLLEQQAPAAATSSCSSKLIHGGLRYLESGQFALVRKALKEQRVLLNIAPQLVKRKPFYIPVYGTTRRRPWQLFIGLSLYAVLGGLGRDNLFRRVSLREAADRFPQLKQSGLQGVFAYWDAQTDDAALTRAVLASAQKLGIDFQCPAFFSGAHSEPEFVSVSFTYDNVETQVSTHALVNAAGPWVNQVLQSVQPVTAGLEMDLVQGTHLLLDVPAPAGVFYVEAPDDGRAVFIMPWQGKTLIGTTETMFFGKPSEATPLQKEIDYLLTVWRRYFEPQHVTVLDKFAGLRVLPKSSASVFHRARDTVLHQSDAHPRVLTLYGGKLTSYRATALQVVRKLERFLPPRTVIADTSTLELLPE